MLGCNEIMLACNDVLKDRAPSQVWRQGKAPTQTSSKPPPGSVLESKPRAPSYRRGDAANAAE